MRNMMIKRRKMRNNEKGKDEEKGRKTFCN